MDLFVYGSLLSPLVWRHIVGRRHASRIACLSHFGCYTVRGQSYPGLRPEFGTHVWGRVVTGIGGRELLRLDGYEGTEYRRIRVPIMVVPERRFAVWVYVLRDEFLSRLSDEPWDYARFIAAGGPAALIEA